MEDEKLLLAEYESFTNCFWKNEEVGEKRVEFFITLTTAVIAGIVALLTNQHANLSDADIRNLATAALLGTFLLGLNTFLRILHRNRVTDEYKEIIGYCGSSFESAQQAFPSIKYLSNPTGGFYGAAWLKPWP